MNIEFTHPLALLLLLALPTYYLLTRRGERGIPLPRAGQLRDAGAGAAVLAWLPSGVRLLAMTALVLAIAGPSTAGAVVEERREGIPIILAVDVSSSMLAQDFRPRDRLEVAKATISRFIDGREADPIGLVAFAGEALTLVPATTHRAVLLAAVASLRVGLLDDGTAIGDGLATAVNRLRPFERGSGVIVLLSDGENNRGTIDPLAAADAASAHGVQVFTIGVGSEGVAPVPVEASADGFQYAELQVGLDEEMLRAVAARTDGAYFRATDPQTLERIYAEIDRMVPSIVETTLRVETIDWTLAMLLAGAVLLLLEWGIRGSRFGALP